jgi:Ca2+-binding RTX toxin-like protein
VGDDELWGQRGDDTLNGDVGNDTLYAGGGNDKLNGGKGEDVLVFNPNEATDPKVALNGDEGDDKIEIKKDFVGEINGGDNDDSITINSPSNSSVKLTRSSIYCRISKFY